MVFERSYNEKVDIWNLGIICFEFLTNTTPFMDNTETKVYIKIMTVIFLFNFNANNFLD